MAAEPATLAVFMLAVRAAHGIDPHVRWRQFYPGRSRKVKLMPFVLAERRGTGEARSPVPGCDPAQDFLRSHPTA